LRAKKPVLLDAEARMKTRIDAIALPITRA
jgi:hypothetical protein